ncbi:MAG: DNA repair protein RecO [Cytophagales bacterium]|nr:DNA repair protein RecO [Cytophagales bacterium]
MSSQSKPTRITLEPAFVLHRYDWSESSLIVEVLTRHHGRVALVAKGAKRPASNFRPVLLPMQPLRITYSGDAEVKTLKSAEWVGGYAMPSGNALLTGFYLNELMMRLLLRDDPQELVYDLYAQTVSVVAQNNGLMTAALRAFELLLLQNMGWLPDLSSVTQTQQGLQGNMPYNLNSDAGLRPATHSESVSLHGHQWLALASALEARDFAQLLTHLTAEPQATQSLKNILRALLNYHCGQPLKTPQMMTALQQL